MSRKKNHLYNFQINLLTIFIDTEKGEDPPYFTQASDKNRKYMKTFSSDINIEGNFKDDDLVCYCFQYKKKDIEADFKKNGYSKILKKIIAEKKSGGCNCKEKNPKGR